MNIFDYLACDHRKVAGLIDALLALNIQSVQQRMFEDIKAELLLHAEAEERTFYRAVTEAVKARDASWDVGHSVHDHDQIRTLLDNLTHEGLTSPKWMLLFGELKYAVEHHVEEEETRVFRLARAVLTPERAGILATEMDTLKTQLMDERHLSVDHVSNA